MPPYDRNKDDCNGEKHTRLTSQDLETILEINKKAVEIYVEVENQNEEVLEKLKKLEEIEKSLFKLTIIFGSMGLGTIIALIKLLLSSH